MSDDRSISRRWAVGFAGTGALFGLGTKKAILAVQSEVPEGLGLIGCRIRDARVQGPTPWLRTLPAVGLAFTHIWHPDSSIARQAASSAGALTVRDPSEMAGKVKGVVIDASLVEGRQHELSVPFLQSGVPVWIDGPLAPSMASARHMVEIAGKTKAPLAACVLEEYLPITTFLRRQALAIAPVSVGMIALNGGQWRVNGVEAVHLASAVFGAGARSVNRIVASADGRNQTIVLEYPQGAGQTLIVIVQSVPSMTDRLWVRMYGSDMLDVRHPNADPSDPTWASLQLPAIYALGHMIRSRKAPQDYRYLLDKTRLYLAVCKSSSLSKGRFMAVSELEDSWTV